MPPGGGPGRANPPVDFAAAPAVCGSTNLLTATPSGNNFLSRRSTRVTDSMTAAKFVEPYIEHGHKAEAVKKVTVSVPLHVLKLLSDERTRRQVNNLRHATNSDLLCEAFLHAFTGQQLPTDEELRRDMAMKKKAAKKAAKKTVKAKAAKKTARKTAKKK